jgi:hypothetical protein
MKTSSLLIIILIAAPAIGFAQVTWTEHLLDGDFNGARGINVVDLDGDGDPDIIGCAQEGDEIVWWENLGANTFSTKQMIATFANGAENVSAADIDGDGDIDVVAALSVAYRVVWYENDGAQNFTQHVIDDAVNGAIDVHTADLDADGNMDILAAGAFSDDIIFYHSQGGGAFIPIVIEAEYDEVRRLRTGDMDGDGDLDIVSCAAFDENPVAWWENQAGATVFIQHPIDPILPGAYSVDVSDMDSDGDLDVVSVGVIADAVVWYENDGSGAFSKHNVDSNLNAATDAIAADVDGNGLIDIVAVAMSGMREYRRYSAYGFDEFSTNLTFAGGRNVLAADINEDGLVDLVTSENVQDDVTWWENNGPPPPSMTVLVPNGGEDWRSGTRQMIQWISFTPTTPVMIELLVADTLHTVITASTDNDGEYEWLLPSDLAGGGNYSVRVSLTDGVAEDVGDGYFTVVALLIMTVTPHNTPIVIPPGGDGYWYSVTVDNNTPTTRTGQLWSNLIIPDGSSYGPLITEEITIGGWGSFQTGTPYGQWIPAYAPPGIYEHVVRVGVFPTLAVATSSFTIEKLAVQGQVFRPVDQWDIDDWQLGPEAFYSSDFVDPQQNTVLPLEYVLHPIYPNPFNGSATVSISLPAAGNLAVMVYNTAGQLVAMLHDGSIGAGAHSLSFDGSQLASGLYFVQAVVPGELRQVQKVMLVR